MSLSAGHKIGTYDIVSQLGAGGMGEVYRARDSKLKREVAIKVLPADVASDRERLARFQREAEVLASLNHPYIAHVYGIEGNALVMELVDGEDLSQWIARGPIPIDEALAIAKQIAEALEAAHDAGIVHRDLKPANIKVRNDGTVKVLDFGLAKAMTADEPKGSLPHELENSPTITSPAMTMRGVILGTAAYMSPEQAKGKAVDKRADVWAFGCVFFEMISGKRAFKGDDVTDIITAVMRDMPDWSALPANTPVAVRTLLKRCIEKDPRKRAPHMAIARLAIDDAMTSTSELMLGAQPAPSGASRRSRTGGMIAIAGIAIALAAAWALGRYLAPVAAPASVVRFQIATNPEAVLQANFNRSLLAVSPDGTQVVIAADKLYLRSVSEAEARPVTGTEVFTSITHPTFSPDGKSIVFWSASDRSLKRITLGSSAISTICPLGEGGYGLDWPNDYIYFSDNGRGIMRVSANGGQPEAVVPLTGREDAYGPQLLPDGDSLLYTLGTRNMPSWDQAKIVVRSVRDNTQKVVLENAHYARYLKSGHLIFGRGGVLYAVPFDLKELAIAGQPIAVIEGVRRAAPGTTGVMQVAVSDSGTLAYIAGPASTTGAPVQIAMFDRKGAAEPLNIPPNAYSHPRISPDGSRVAMTVDDGKEAQVWIHGLARASAARRLTFGGSNSLAEWSHDGDRVAFQSSREGDTAIWWQRADGTDTARRVTRPAAGAAHVPQSFSPDNQHLLFDEKRGSGVTLWDWSIAEGKGTQVAIPETDVPTDAMFSPDGKWITYTIRLTSVQSIVYVEPYPATGARYQVSVPGEDAHHPVWSRDGKELYYTPGPGNRFHVKPITTSPTFAYGEALLIPRPFVNAPPSSERTYDIAPDGRIIGLRMDVGPDGRQVSPQVNVVLNWFEELKQRVPIR